MVSRLEMLGLRDLVDVGVDGTEDKLPENESYALYEGEEATEDGVEGNCDREPELRFPMFRRGEDGRWMRPLPS
jgi:hypothetical protein